MAVQRTSLMARSLHAAFAATIAVCAASTDIAAASDLSPWVVERRLHDARLSSLPLPLCALTASEHGPAYHAAPGTPVCGRTRFLLAPRLPGYLRRLLAIPADSLKGGGALSLIRQTSVYITIVPTRASGCAWRATAAGGLARQC